MDLSGLDQVGSTGSPSAIAKFFVPPSLHVSQGIPPSPAERLDNNWVHGVNGTNGGQRHPLYEVDRTGSINLFLKDFDFKIVIKVMKQKDLQIKVLKQQQDHKSLKIP